MLFLVAARNDKAGISLDLSFPEPGALGWSVAAAIVWLLVPSSVMFLVRPTAQNLADRLTARLTPFNYLTSSVTAAICEEVWRCFCLQALAQIHGLVASCVITALVFGLGHTGRLTRKGFAALGSMGLSGLYTVTGSLVTMIVCHAVFNVGIFVVVRTWIASHKGDSPRTGFHAAR